MAQKFEKWYCSWSKTSETDFKWVLKKAKSKPSGVFETQQEAYNYFVDLNINGYLWYHQFGKYVRVVKSIKSLQDQKVVIVDSNDDEEKNLEQERRFEELKRQNDEFIKAQKALNDSTLSQLKSELEEIKKTDDLENELKLKEAQEKQAQAELKAQRAQDDIDFLKSQIEQIYQNTETEKNHIETQEIDLLKLEIENLKEQNNKNIQDDLKYAQLEEELSKLKTLRNDQSLVSQNASQEINELKLQIQALMNKNKELQNTQEVLIGQVNQARFDNDHNFATQEVNFNPANTTEITTYQNERLLKLEDHILKTQEVLINALAESSKSIGIAQISEEPTGEFKYNKSTSTVVIEPGKPKHIWWIVALVIFILLLIGFMTYMTISFLGYAPWMW